MINFSYSIFQIRFSCTIIKYQVINTFNIASFDFKTLSFFFILFSLFRNQLEVYNVFILSSIYFLTNVAVLILLIYYYKYNFTNNIYTAISQ